VRIVVSQTGGYGGVHGTAAVDTSHLEPRLALAIEQLAQQAMESVDRRGPPVGADLMRYEITIEEEDRSRSLTFIDDGGAEGGPIKRRIEAVQRRGSP